MTVKEHLINFFKWHWNNNILTFKTHHIQELSQRGKQRFGRYLGSPETYTRIFRDMKENGDISVKKIKNPKSRETLWYLKECRL